MPFWADIWFSFIAIAAIYTQNLSLRINTVTLYQVSKLLNIPAQCLFQYFTKGKVFNLWVYGSLVVLTAGVALSTIAEFNFDATIGGIFAALSGVVSVVTEQAEIGRLREKFNINTVDFVHSNSLHRMVMSGCLILVVEREALIMIPQMRWQTAALLFLSCLIATGINLTVVAVIGKFGAVTTAVVGHVKTINIISLGFVLHPPPMNWILGKQLSGITVALLGAVKYGQYTSFPDADWCNSARQLVARSRQGEKGTAGKWKADTNGQTDNELISVDATDEHEEEGLLQEMRSGKPEATVVGAQEDKLLHETQSQNVVFARVDGAPA